MKRHGSNLPLIVGGGIWLYGILKMTLKMSLIEFQLIQVDQLIIKNLKRFG